jgi:hypothetical protein
LPRRNATQALPHFFGENRGKTRGTIGACDRLLFHDDDDDDADAADDDDDDNADDDDDADDDADDSKGIIKRLSDDTDLLPQILLWIRR